MQIWWSIKLVRIGKILQSAKVLRKGRRVKGGGILVDTRCPSWNAHMTKHFPDEGKDTTVIDLKRTQADNRTLLLLAIVFFWKICHPNVFHLSRLAPFSPIIEWSGSMLMERCWRGEWRLWNSALATKGSRREASKVSQLVTPKRCVATASGAVPPTVPHGLQRKCKIDIMYEFKFEFPIFLLFV